MFRKLFLIVTFLFLSVVTANALPLYITVEGVVTHSSSGSGYIINDEVSAVFMIDKEQDGYRTDENGNRVNFSDYYYSGRGYSYEVDYYLSEYIGGDCLPVDPEANSGINHHFASEGVMSSRKYSLYYNTLHCDSDSEPSLNSAQVRLARSSLSDSISFFEYNLNDQFQLFSHDGYDDYVLADVAIAALSDTNPIETAPVPEPATMFLLGSGILGLIGIGKKRK